MSNRTKYPYRILHEPIDFEALAACYLAENWRWWHCGVPNSKQVKECYEEHLKTAREHGTNYCSSGGMTVEIIAGNPVFSISPQLAQHLPKPNEFTTEPLNQTNGG